jgi:hypothetical protein
MDLDPDIEAANRKNERKEIDLMDESQVKPIVDMVIAGILNVESARKMLGIPTEEGEATSEASHGLPADLAATGQSATCGVCSHFTPETNHCQIHESERSADASACRFIDRRELG